MAPATRVQKINSYSRRNSSTVFVNIALLRLINSSFFLLGACGYVGGLHFPGSPPFQCFSPSFLSLSLSSLYPSSSIRRLDYQALCSLSSACALLAGDLLGEIGENIAFQKNRNLRCAASAVGDSWLMSGEMNGLRSLSLDNYEYSNNDILHPADSKDENFQSVSLRTTSDETGEAVMELSAAMCLSLLS
ncbi:hypothetical protein HPP92_005383 [Vanilla planifolia]|uniref:Uncharacterized protein n=1 Tax=Vanilla planifolia TaxID=51239 RepID=A0A835RML4_VANPL|nr:hypothetical protein HPP92_005383 [Vanilla planifolia]